MRVFVDTNIFVYLFDRDEPVKRRMAHQLMERQQIDLELSLSTQVLQEFYVTVTRKMKTPLTNADAGRAVHDLSKFAVQPITTDVIFSAITLVRQNSFSFWDALIVEAALRSGAQQLLTEDMQDGRIIDGMTIRNPLQ